MWVRYDALDVMPDKAGNFPFFKQFLKLLTRPTY